MTYYLRIFVGKRSFHVRRQLLLDESEYFRVMCSGDWRESSHHELELKGPVPTERAAEIIFDFLETRQIGAKEEDLEEVTMAADFFRIHSVFPAIQKEIMNLENWTEFVKLAEIYQKPSMKDDTYSFVGDNYIVASETEEFDELSQEDKELIRKMPLCNSEQVLVVLTDDLELKYFHFNDKTWEYLTKIPVSETLGRRDIMLYGRTVSAGQYIVVLGVEDISDAADFVYNTNSKTLTLNKTLVYNTKTNEWSEGKPLELSFQLTRHNSLPYTVAVLGQVVYVFSAREHYTYNIENNKWRTFTPPREVLTPCLNHANSSVLVCADTIHVIWLSDGSLSIISYDPLEDKWDEPRCILKLADSFMFRTSPCSDGGIYIVTFSRGKTNRRGKTALTQQMYMYDLSTGTVRHIKKWQHRHLDSMSCAMFGDTLYRFEREQTVCITLRDDFRETVAPPLTGEVQTSLVVRVPCDFLY